MNLSAPALRSCASLFVVLLLIVSIAAAKEPSTKGPVATPGKRVSLATATKNPVKSPANDPWQISLTVREDQKVVEPIAGLRPMGKNPLFGGLLKADGFMKGAPTAGGTMPPIGGYSVPTTGPATGFQGPTGFPGMAGVGFSEVGTTPVFGILPSTPQQPVIAGDASGNGTIDFVDVGAAMHPFEDPSAVTSFGSNPK